MRIMGLDFGSKTVGVALSDPLGLTAQPVETSRRTSESKLRKTLARIEAIIEESQVERIVLGYPTHMDHSVGDRAEKTEEFKMTLERRTGLPVVLWDERLTSVEAHRALDETKVKKSEHEKYVDQLAAVLILQGYLDANRNA